MRSALLAISAFMLVPLGAVSSQAVLQVESGDRIRITARQNMLDNQTARVLSVSGDSLLLRIAPAETLAVALAGVTRLEVSTGRRTHTRRGLGMGALIGVTSGALLGYASGDDKRGWCCFFLTAEEKALVYGTGLGVTGLVIGAIVGATRVSDRWTSVPLGAAMATPRLQVRRGRTHLAVAVTF
jgi:hypothetical protein